MVETGDRVTHKIAPQFLRDPASFATIRFAHIVASVRPFDSRYQASR